MAISKKVIDFRNLVTNTVVPRAFTDMIRNDDNIFWSKPYGTSKDFHQAFHSSKTNKALRYVMAVSGILGEENVLNRSLAGLRSDLHFKVEPQYVQKHGRIKLSHFEIKGFTQSGHGKILKLNNTAKKMMMGTPVYPGRANMAIVGIKGRGGRVITSRSYTKARVSQALKTMDPLLAEAIRQGGGDLDALIEKWKGMPITEESEAALEDIVKDVRKAKRRRKKAAEAGEEVQLTEDEVALEKILKAVRKARGSTKPRKSRSRSRNLTVVEKARILRAITQILNHLQGIMWVLHYTIKLNDRRRQFLYIDDDYVWVGDASRNNVRLDLYGFPEHMEHYINQQMAFNEWFDFLILRVLADALLLKMIDVCNHGKRIDQQYYESEEDEQDALDDLLANCSDTLRVTTEFFHKVEKSVWIFSAKVVPRTFEVPMQVPRHRRHTKKNRMFKPKKTVEGARMQVSYYESLHSDYWDKKREEE